MTPSIEIRKRDQELFEARTGSKPRESRISKVKILRTRLWVESILKANKVSTKELSSQFYKEVSYSNAIMKWLKGDQVANPKSVKTLERMYPGVQHTYDIDVFDLLEIKITKEKVVKLLNKYLHKNTHPFQLSNNTNSSIYIWRLPAIKVKEKDYSPIILKEDSNGLFERGGMYGFIGILILLREAELNNDSFLHEVYLKDAYRALAGFCRNKAFKYRWEEFYDALKDIHSNMYSSERLVRPKRDVIKKQIFSKNHITIRAVRPRSLKDFRFIEPEIPYTLASFRT